MKTPPVASLLLPEGLLPPPHSAQRWLATGSLPVVGSLNSATRSHQSRLGFSSLLDALPPL